MLLSDRVKNIILGVKERALGTEEKPSALSFLPREIGKTLTSIPKKATSFIQDDSLKDIFNTQKGKLSDWASQKKSEFSEIVNPEGWSAKEFTYKAPIEGAKKGFEKIREVEQKAGEYEVPFLSKESTARYLPGKLAKTTGEFMLPQNPAEAALFAVPMGAVLKPLKNIPLVKKALAKGGKTLLKKGTKIIPEKELSLAQSELRVKMFNIADDIVNKKMPAEQGLKELKILDDKLAKAGTEKVFNVKKPVTQLTDIYNQATKKAPETFKGFKDLTTKVLTKLEGKSVVSKQFISDMTNMPELKQTEKNLIRDVLDSQKGDKIPVKEFAEKVKSELLPLKMKTQFDAGKINVPTMREAQRYENITLPGELRGNVANYSEHIYESPIKTSAGNIHFSGASQKYYGHTRIEDMAIKGIKIPKEGLPSGGTTLGLPISKTRRIIELQSDLYQKGALEAEFRRKIYNSKEVVANLNKEESIRYNELQKVWKNDELTKTQAIERSELYSKAVNNLQAKSKLGQYNDPTAHFRIAREEIKLAAKDGKTKLQFPTGKTAMEVEGLIGDSGTWMKSIMGEEAGILRNSDLKIGNEIQNSSGEWIITDVLENGKFKAVQKHIYDLAKKDIKDPYILAQSEAFDISGKVDTSNPIYRFYEKTLGKYLTKKYNAKEITDSKGVKWFEIDIKPEMSKSPIEAFGSVPFLQASRQKQQDNNQDNKKSYKFKTLFKK